MKKILLSLGTLALVGAAVVGGTIAFYNDTETSTGNIFVAGSVDLKVDHTYAEYNGNPCDPNCTPEGNDLIVNGGFENPEPIANGGKWEVYPDGSLTSWNIVSGSGLEIQENGAVPGAFAHGGDQLAELDSHTPGSPASAIEQVIDTIPGQKYQLKFWHSPRPNNGPDTDNAVELKVLVTSTSGTMVNQIVGLPSSGATTNWTEHTFSFIALDTKTTVRFTDAGSQPDTLGGYIDDVSVYKLICDGPLYPYGGQCDLWETRDLTHEQFWYFPDIKPGDWGTSIVSLHVTDNDAFACLIPANINDQENPTQPYEPEISAGDALGSGNPLGDGELSNQIEFFMWQDNNANNTYDGGDTVLVPFGTPFNQIQNVMPALSINGNAPITLVGINWCAGDQTSETTCDGAGMTDVVQSDMMTSDFVAYAVQQRNNTAPVCSQIPSLPNWAPETDVMPI